MELEKADTLIKEKIRKTIYKIGYIPDKRTFKLYLQNDLNIIVSVKRYRRLMKEMYIKAYKPKKDAYKGQARYFHEAYSMQIDLYKNILVKINIAKDYLQSLPKDIFTHLRDLSNWRYHKELHYVFDIPAIY